MRVLFLKLLRYCIAAMWLAGFVGLSAAQTPGATAPRAARTVLVVGDSLSAEYGLARGTGWVALLDQRLAKDKPGTRVVNASISGDTTFGGRSRLPALLAQHQPTLVVIELGGNDALRGLSLDATRGNLEWMTQQAKKMGAQVLLLGMQMPPNYGADYGRKFSELYVQVSRTEKAGLVPFLLHGVADVPEMAHNFQADGIHPLATAHPRMLDNVWPELKKLL